MKTNISTIIACIPVLIVAVIFTGCENDQLSQNPDVVPHKTLKPPLDDGSEGEFDDATNQTAQRAEFDGTIKEVSELNIVVTLDDGSERTFQTSPNTEVTLNSYAAATADIMIGESVHIVADVKEDLLTARTVAVTALHGENDDLTDDTSDDEDSVSSELTIEGEISSVSETELIVYEPGGVDHVFELTPETIITLNGEEAAVVNIQRGQNVTVAATVIDEIKTAATVVIQK